MSAGLDDERREQWARVKPGRGFRSETSSSEAMGPGQRARVGAVRGR